MTSFRVRPKFAFETDKPLKEVLERMAINNGTTHPHVEGRFSKSHGFFIIKASEQHFWSPQLNISFEETDRDTLIIRGRYGPNPSVWLMFLFGNILLGIAAFFITIWGLAKLNLHKDATILWILPFLLGGFVFLYIVAQTGQKLGVEQTFQIHHCFEDCLGESIHIH
jgi:hypothetical protein